MRRLAVASLVAGVLAVSTGCASNSPSPVSGAAAKSLRPLVSALRDAAAGKSESDVTGAISALDAEVAALQASDDLSPHRAKQIEDAATRLLTDFKAAHVPKPSATPQSTAPSPSDTPITPKPSHTVTITVPPTDTTSDTASPDPSNSSTPKTDDS